VLAQAIHMPADVSVLHQHEQQIQLHGSRSAQAINQIRSPNSFVSHRTEVMKQNGKKSLTCSAL
jgi:hypothetical protein